MDDNGFSTGLALGKSDGGFGGSGEWLFAILVLAMLGGNGFGFGRGGYGDYGQFATAASQQEILFGQQFQGLDNKIDRIGNGIADATFALNNTIKDGIYANSSATATEGRALSSQIADCCCKTQQNIDSVRFDMSNYFNAIQANDTANTQKILDVLAQNKIESLQGRIQELELANATRNIVRYPTDMAYSAGNSPFCNCNNGCGCCNV